MPHSNITGPGILADFFNEEDRAFLKRMFAVHPHMQSEFERYLFMSPAHRQSEALEALSELPRTGWKNLGIPNPESVYDHTMHLCAQARKAAPATGLNAAHLVAMAMVHDLPEAIVGDFAPSDRITNEDKHRLEGLAARVIFADDLESLARYHEYEAKQTPSAQLLSDLDKCDACEQALIYEAHHPALAHEAFTRFVDSARPKLKTAHGNAMLTELVANAETIREQARMDHRGPIADRIATTYGAQYAQERGR